MNVAESARLALSAGLREIIQQFELPTNFTAATLTQTQELLAKNRVAERDWMAERIDMRSKRFVTLDPAQSTDLDQAFYLERSGENLTLHYALADIDAFIEADTPIDTEAWQRGVTIYGLLEKIPLYPKPISQGLASLLPDDAKPAHVVTLDIDPNGKIELRNICKAIVQSHVKLAYEKTTPNEVTHLSDFAERFWKNEEQRGTIRVEFPQQEVVTDPESPGGVRLALRARNETETANSALSLAVNLAIAQLFISHQIGLFRVMDEPDDRTMFRLRRQAHALGITWRASQSLRDLQQTMDATNVTHQKFLLEARRSGGRARYATYSTDNSPWHSAIAAAYTHATAPMRRLADRYVLQLAYRLFHGLEVSDSLRHQLDALPDVMQRFESRAGNVDRAVIDLLEAVSLQHRVGETLEAEIVDAGTNMVQALDPAIRAKVLRLPKKAEDGDIIRVRIDVADPTKRQVVLSYVSG